MNFTVTYIDAKLEEKTEQVFTIEDLFIIADAYGVKRVLTEQGDDITAGILNSMANRMPF